MNQSHLNIDFLEEKLGKTNSYIYVEVGKYKPYLPNTIRAAIRRGYKVEEKTKGVYFIYPKNNKVQP